MAKKKLFNISSDALRIIFLIVGSALSTIVLTFSIMAMVRIQNKDYTASSVYMLLVFMVLGLSRLITFIQHRSRASFLRFIVLFVFYITLGTLLFFAKDHPYLYNLVGGLFCVSIIVSRLLKLMLRHTVRDIILNVIIIAFAVLLAIGLFVPSKEDAPFTPMVIVCFLVAVTALAEVISTSFAQLKVKILFKIIFRTFALEVILGLLTMIVASALIFMYIEVDPVSGNPWTFGDGLWYAFATVTTIGFGDITAATNLGKILTVALGIYGIVVVAVITSIIVNFYNETAGKRDAQELKEIKQEEKDSRRK